MSILKILFRIIILSFLITILGCSQQKTAANQIRVGVIAGPETQIMEVAKKVAEKNYGIDINIVQFSDYTMPNEALADGSIDANMFQHQPYLQTAINAKGYKIISIARTFIYPMAIYSKNISNLAQLKPGATVAVPNDPANEARALLLLQKAHLIQLAPNAGVQATTLDIIKDPKNLVIKAIDAAQLPRVLPDVDIAIINTNYAMLAGLLPSRDGLLVEDSNSPYANLVVIRAVDQNDPKYAKLVASLQSPEVIQEAQKLFQGQAIPGWK